MKKLLFVFNPKSGMGLIKNHLLDIVDIMVKAGYDPTVYPTQARGDATRKVCEDGANYDRIVCSGGDGTLDEVVTGMMQCEERLPIGYIPAGSTNDFAKSLGISNNMVEAAKGIVDGKLFACDIGEFNEDAFVYIAAFGLFTEVSYATEQNLKNALGHTAYILEGVKSLSAVKTYRMKIESEEVTTEGEFVYGMITNSSSVGGFKNVTAKDIELDDGKFEVILLKSPKNPMELQSVLTKLFNQEFDDNFARLLYVDKIKITSDTKIPWTLDGEYGGKHNDVEIEVIKHAVDLIVKGE